jgi:hypothetical protein
MKPGQREEITDLISQQGMIKLRRGQVLKFNYEGSITAIKITRIDRKNWRIWGEHIALVDQKIVVSHTGHDVTYEEGKTPFCNDCQVPVSEPSTEDGEVKAKEREDNRLSDGTRID